jgi:hypothetical protein
MTEVFGIPVSGKPMKNRRHQVNQRPLSDLREVFEALIADERVIEFGWSQYTPYFNDGDVCEFSVGDPWIRTIDDEDVDDRYDLQINDTHPTLGHLEWRKMTDEEYALKVIEYKDRGWGTPYNRGHFSKPQGSKYPDLLELAKRLDVDAAEYEDAMYDAFGDHAQVTVTKTGIQIDEYDHE